MALCEGLDRFSDHEVRHEPPPEMLEEAWLKHHGRPYHSPTLRERLEDFRRRDGTSYGESVRAPNLLPDIVRAAPETVVLILVRDPHEYVRSAHYKRVFRKGNQWDKMRLMPEGVDGASLAERIAHHWTVVNRYLLGFASSWEGASVYCLGPEMGEITHHLPDWIGVEFTDPRGFRAHLAQRRNASTGDEMPDGYVPGVIDAICVPTWDAARGMSRA